MNTELTFDLGYVGHKAEKFQAMFNTYTAQPNKYGYFLRFENYTLTGNEGVICVTNCYENETDFIRNMFTKLLFEVK